MHAFALGDQVFPRRSQQLPAYTVVGVGPVMITVRIGRTMRELIHYLDLVQRDPAVQYQEKGYTQLG